MTRLNVFATSILVAGLLTHAALAQRPAAKPQIGGEQGPQAAPRGDREAQPERADRSDNRHVRLRQGDVPIGSLGHPLGESLAIEGTRANGFKFGTQTLRVDTINGKRLANAVDISLDNIRELPHDTRIELKGYETGAMEGPIPAAVKAAEDQDEQVFVPQRGWQWNAYFVALSSVKPALTIEERPTGFKTLKRGRRASPPGEASPNGVQQKSNREGNSQQYRDYRASKFRTATNVEGRIFAPGCVEPPVGRWGAFDWYARTDERRARSGGRELNYFLFAKTRLTAKGVETLVKCKITWDGGAIEPQES